MRAAAADLEGDAVQRAEGLGLAAGQRKVVAEPLDVDGEVLVVGEDAHRPRLAERRRVREQSARIGAAGRGQHLLDGALLLDAATLQNHQPLGAVGRDAEIVRHQQHGRAVLAAQLVDQVEDAPLHGDVERAGRLVGHDQGGIESDGNGDQHALPHAARKLVRILLRAHLGRRQADALQQLDHPLLDRSAVAPLVDLHHLGELRANGAHGVERAARILRDQAHHCAADTVQPLLRPARNVRAVEPDDAAVDLAVAGQQAEHGLRRRGLARSRFAHQGDHFARHDLERDAVDHTLVAIVRAVGDGEVVDLEKGCCAHGSVRPMALEMRSAESTTRTTTRPGAAVSHQARER